MNNIRRIFAVLFVVTAALLMNVTVFALEFTVQPNDGEAYPYDTAKITWTMDRQPVWMEISNNAETIKHWSNPIGTTFSYDLPPAKYPY
ncbi:MAG: hypothetical protein IJ583_11745, partial [Firmicutes bacterium]|nr:hypothetical protein [Bacillota bacterium]